MTRISTLDINAGGWRADGEDNTVLNLICQISCNLLMCNSYLLFYIK